MEKMSHVSQGGGRFTLLGRLLAALWVGRKVTTILSFPLFEINLFGCSEWARQNAVVQILFLFFWPQYFSGPNNGQASLMKTCPYRPFGVGGFLACVFRCLPTEAVAVTILKRMMIWVELLKPLVGLSWVTRGFCQLVHTRLIKAPCQSRRKRNLVDFIASVYISWK
jgi:hypothetical protein